MKIFNSLNEWIAFRKDLPAQTTLGFAPTMGNLHDGHASLFIASQKDNDYTVSSLFINPTQFNRPDDFKLYPRTLDDDIALMTRCGVNFCILPKENEIYADGYNYQVQEHSLCHLMEGKHRPGHFNGVLTVVMKLLNLTQPTNAYFGEKDYQQYLLISGMVKALFMSPRIIPCPTIRESSGLAFSSRNNRLNAEQRVLAEQFARIFHQGLSCEEIQRQLNELGLDVEYIEEYLGRRFIAVMIGDIRLIDNYLLP